MSDYLMIKVLDAVLRSSDRPLPDKAFLGDLCKHDGDIWVFGGQWMRLKDLVEKME